MIYKSKNFRKNILLLGDSHIRVFESRIFKYFLPRKKFIVSYIPGATAYGILNKNSKTGAYNKIKNALEQYQYKQIIICLGEVDTSYTLWAISKRDNKNVNELLNLSISRYKTLLNEIKNYAPVTILSTPFSTIDDKKVECDDSIQGIRKQIGISYTDKIDLALKFNKEIEVFSKKNTNIEFIDFTTLALDNRKRVRTFLINRKNLCDHHYKRWIFALLVLWKLRYKW